MSQVPCYLENHTRPDDRPPKMYKSVPFNQDHLNMSYQLQSSEQTTTNILKEKK